MVKDQTLLSLCACIEVVAVSCVNLDIKIRARKLRLEINAIFKDSSFLQEI